MCIRDSIATGFGTDENGMPKKPNKTDDFSFGGKDDGFEDEMCIRDRLVAIDEPTGAHGGGAVAAPIAGDILEKVLTYFCLLYTSPSNSALHSVRIS